MAAGLTGLEMGSDIGGSARKPAHFCGVFGHDPTFDIVPLGRHIPALPEAYPGEYTADSDINTAAPMAHSAKVLDLVMNLITSPQDPQVNTWKIELPRAHCTLSKGGD